MTLMQNAITAAPLLSVQGLTKRYGARIGCMGVGFDLYPGEVLGIVGESGSGKSTLLSCLAGHQRPDEGRILFDGADVLAFSEAERRRLLRGDWAYVHQNPRDGLRMGVSAGGNVGERLMAVGGATMPPSARVPPTGWVGSRSRRTGSTTAPRPSRAACSNACRSPATW